MYEAFNIASTYVILSKALKIRHQVQKGFHDIFVGISQDQKGYLIYIPHKQKIVSSYDVVFDENFFSELSYRSQPYAEDMDI